MERIRIAVMQPKYQVNLGYIARIAKNFGIGELYLIAPRCKWRGKQAIKYSKHAHALLDGAHICGSIKEAAAGRMVVGTTGIWRKSRSSFYNSYSLYDFAELARRNRNRQLCILLGRDDIGLTSEEMKECDAVVFIPASADYPVLNISHALAILLYEFGRGEKDVWRLKGSYATGKELDALARRFSDRIAKNSRIRDKKAVGGAFRRMLKRARPTTMEVNALHSAFSDD